MGTKTIGITEAVYERLAAEKRTDESFTETIDRLLDAVASDWRQGFGRYAGEDGEVFDRLLREVRDDHAEGFADRQREVLEELGVELDDQGTLRSKPDGAE